MNRAPAVVGPLFGLALALVITLAGPLLLFNPWVTSALQQAHDVPEAFAAPASEIDRVTGGLLVDIYVDGAFDASLEGEEPLLDERERSHMSDVAGLVRLLAGIAIAAAVVAAVTAVWLRREPVRQGRIMLIVGGGIGALALLLAGIFAVAFEPAFLAFHEIFFPPGTYLFEEGSALITLFPEGFWFDAALIAGATVILAALVVTVIGARLWRARSASREAT